MVDKGVGEIDPVIVFQFFPRFLVSACRGCLEITERLPPVLTIFLALLQGWHREIVFSVKARRAVHNTGIQALHCCKC